MCDNNENLEYLDLTHNQGWQIKGRQVIPVDDNYMLPKIGSTPLSNMFLNHRGMKTMTSIFDSFTLEN